MNWRLVLQLSLFGLAMGIATVFWIPSTVEPLFWLVIFLTCAYVIGGSPISRPFLHGLALGVVNSVWITTAHVLFFGQYLARHPNEADMLRKMPMPESPRLMMTVTGPVVGVASGIVLGLFALVAAKILSQRGQAAAAAP